jgi:hypothetical protein
MVVQLHALTRVPVGSAKVLSIERDPLRVPVPAIQRTAQLLRQSLQTYRYMYSEHDIVDTNTDRYETETDTVSSC